MASIDHLIEYKILNEDKYGQDIKNILTRDDNKYWVNDKKDKKTIILQIQPQKQKMIQKLQLKATKIQKITVITKDKWWKVHTYSIQVANNEVNTFHIPIYMQQYLQKITIQLQIRKEEVQDSINHPENIQIKTQKLQHNINQEKQKYIKKQQKQIRTQQIKHSAWHKDQCSLIYNILIHQLQCNDHKYKQTQNRLARIVKFKQINQQQIKFKQRFTKLVSQSQLDQIQWFQAGYIEFLFRNTLQYQEGLAERIQEFLFNIQKCYMQNLRLSHFPKIRSILNPIYQNLQWVNLHHNQICNIQTLSFINAPIKILMLDKNHIVTIKSLRKYFLNLDYIHFAKNQIRQVNEYSQFQSKGKGLNFFLSQQFESFNSLIKLKKIRQTVQNLSSYCSLSKYLSRREYDKKVIYPSDRFIEALKKRIGSKQ